MKFSKFERLYGCVCDTMESSAGIIDKVAEYLQQVNEPMTCKEIARAIYGEEFFSKAWMRQSFVSRTSSALHHLIRGGYVKREEIDDGAPFTVKREKMVWADENGKSLIIEAIDPISGKKYDIANPSRHVYYTITVMEDKIIQPKKAVFTWIHGRA